MFFVCVGGDEKSIILCHFQKVGNKELGYSPKMVKMHNKNNKSIIKLTKMMCANECSLISIVQNDNIYLYIKM